MGTSLILPLPDHAHAPTGPGCEKRALRSHPFVNISESTTWRTGKKAEWGLCRWVWFPFNDEKNACLLWADDKLIHKMLHKCSLLSCRVNVNNIKENIPPFRWKGLTFKALHNGAGMGYTLSNGLFVYSAFHRIVTEGDNKRERFRSWACSLFLHLCVWFFFNDNSLRTSQ